MTFPGEIADHYALCRRGFDRQALDFVAARLDLGPDALVVDLGCGTGQLTIPLSSRVRHVVGMDPQPEMLAHARAAADRAGVTASWQLGSDADLPVLAALLGESSVDAVAMSNAAHFVDTARFATDAAALLAPHGRVGVIAHGVPIWCQDSAWSTALAAFLARRYDTDLSTSRHTDDQTLERCRADLAAAGFRTTRHRMDRHVAVSAEWLCGNLFSAMPVEWLPAPAERPAFAADLADALRSAQPTGDLVEDARVTVLVAQR